jgi:hypothetical protein
VPSNPFAEANIPTQPMSVLKVTYFSSPVMLSLHIKTPSMRAFLLYETGINAFIFNYRGCGDGLRRSLSLRLGWLAAPLKKSCQDN